MTRLDKYIQIIEWKPARGGKTKRWNVINKQTQEILGNIRWYGGWRKYVFYNEYSGFMDWDFLRLIADFCEDMTIEHYDKKL